MLSVQCSVCNVQCAVFSVQCAVCRRQCSVFSVQCAVCSVQFAVCSVQYAVCSVRCAVCSVQCAVCSVQCAVCTLHRSFIANIEVTLMISCSAMQFIPRRCPFGALHHCYLMLHQVAALWWSTTSNASKAGAHKQAPSFTSSQHHTAHQIPINGGVALPFLDVCNVWMRGFQVLCCDVFSFPQFQWKPDF